MLCCPSVLSFLFLIATTPTLPAGKSSQAAKDLDLNMPTFLFFSSPLEEQSCQVVGQFHMLSKEAMKETEARPAIP